MGVGAAQGTGGTRRRCLGCPPPRPPQPTPSPCSGKSGRGWRAAPTPPRAPAGWHRPGSLSWGAPSPGLRVGSKGHRRAGRYWGTSSHPDPSPPALLTSHPGFGGSRLRASPPGQCSPAGHRPRGHKAGSQPAGVAGRGGAKDKQPRGQAWVRYSSSVPPPQETPQPPDTCLHIGKLRQDPAGAGGHSPGRGRRRRRPWPRCRHAYGAAPRSGSLAGGAGS